MNKKITAAVFAAVLTIGMNLSLQAAEETVIYDETAVSGAAVEVCFEEESEIIIEYLYDDGAEAEYVFEEAFPQDEELPKTKADNESEEGFSNFALSYSLESVSEEDSEQETAISISMQSVGSIVNAYDKSPKLPRKDDTESSDDEAEEEKAESSGSDGGSASEDEDAPMDDSEKDCESLLEDGNAGSEDGQADISGDNSGLSELSHEDEEKNKEEAPAAEKSSSRLGRSSSGGRKDYSESQVSEEASAETAEAEENDENELSDKTKVYSGEDLIKEAESGKDTITFGNGGAELEVPSDFIKQNDIDEDDVISVSINRTPETVEINVKINNEEVEEIEGAKINLSDDKGAAESYPADSLGEIYIKGSYDKDIWPLGSAFPFVIAISYILLMGGAVAALLKKIKAR